MELEKITLSEPIESALLSYIRDRQDSSSARAIVREALEEFLTQRGYLQPPSTKRLRIAPAPKGSGYADTSVNHDLVIVNPPKEKLQ